MINKLQTLTLLIISISSLATLLPGQGIDLGAASDFSVFTAAGAFNNGGFTLVDENVGTHTGSVLGFPPGITFGGIHEADANTFAAAAATGTAYTAAVLKPCQYNIGVTLGNDQTLIKGIYCPGDAVTLVGNLNLDAEGDPDAVFIIKINGAFATSPFSSITLLNGASSCNVYFQVNGQLTLDTGTDFKGIALVTGAMIVLEGASIEGKLLSTAGAVTLTNNHITECLAGIFLPVDLITFNAASGSDKKSVELNWQTASESNHDHFVIERSNDGHNFSPIGSSNTKGNSNSVLNYKFIDIYPLSQINYYRLNIIDKAGKSVYSEIRSFAMSSSQADVSIYPNPFAGTLTITLPPGSEKSDNRFVLYDQLGRIIMSRPLVENQSHLNMSHVKAGPCYFTIMNGGKIIKSGHLIAG